ncbi:class I SAM-dependent methyltransferase [Francisella tularensis]|uniref:class I SAM-dependent methyltransferase n=1 Tax=Francisella tularensis TaxID=263 RepID=UPI001C0EB2CE|nr:methyltransferase domain-containing protein [Francisella tularensis]MBK2110243.1 methyltransferase domain-containing protein [Francisella tularensis subsp. novicida FSC595]
MKMLNIACGSRYHKDWINIDFHASSKGVKKVNILNGLPFKTNYIDVIYSSHFLEHLNQDQADFVLKESFRVLKENGIIRLVVPDLENVCQEYLRVLNLVTQDKKYEKNYEWIMVELLDQLVRNKSGGKMGDIFSKVSQTKVKYIADYILERTGDDLLKESKSSKREITYDKIKNKLLYSYLKLVRLLIPKSLRDLVFLNTSIGERHQWMYDKYSLSKKLFDLGFKNVEIKSFNDSSIVNFNNYFLDIKKDGLPYKGIGSLYIEAKK